LKDCENASNMLIPNSLLETTRSANSLDKYRKNIENTAKKVDDIKIGTTHGRLEDNPNY